MECNGIALIDETKPFCKLNCKWVFKRKGRKKLDSTKRLEEKKNSNKKNGKLVNPISICLSMEKDQLDYIKKQALTESIQKGQYVEANELIRQAIQKVFPMPTNFDMFGASL